MKELHEILNDHFLPSEKEEIVFLFTKHGFFDILERSSGQLKIELENTLSTGNSAPLPALTTVSSNLLVAVNNKVAAINNPEEKRRVQLAISQIAIRQLLSIVTLFSDQASDIFNVVQKSLQMTSELFGYNYSDISKLMRFEEFINLTQTLTGKKYSDELHVIRKTEILSLVWTNKTQLGFLTSELKRRKWIKSQSEFSKLFGNSDVTLRVHWDMKYKYELVRLFYVLAQGDFIRPKKGFLSIPERFIVDLSNVKLKKNSLKKINSKITTDPDKHIAVIESVDDIIRIITKTKMDLRKVH